MISVVIIGSGNVAHHLTHIFLKSKNVLVKQLYARSLGKIKSFEDQVSITDDFETLIKADVYILAISDDAISQVSSLFKNDSFVVHTSGSVSISALKNKGKKGVFYPLQSFSKEKKVDFNNVPLCIEAKENANLLLLEKLANTISKKVYRINSLQRSKLHVAAVFVNNFVNYMYTVGDNICNTYDVPFEILHPLIEETALKIKQISPKDAQTGPAKRDDQKTIQRHLNDLNEKQQEIYNLITKSIQNG